MGIFSGSTTIQVSSTLYNLAGPEEDRPDYLKGTIFASVMADSPSLADDITNSYFKGPGIKQRQLFNYAVRNDLAGLPTVSATNSAPVEAAVVAAEIDLPASPPAPAGLEVSVQNAFVNDGDPDPFLERWILENHPTRLGELWTGDVDGQDFSVQFPNGDFYEFTDTEYDLTKRYIVAKYFLTIPDNTQDLVEGSVNSVTSLPDFEDVNEAWVEQSSTGSFVPTTLQREMVETRSFSNGDPDEVDPPVDADVVENANTSVDVHDRTKVIGATYVETELEYQKYTHTGTDSVTTGYYFEEVTDVSDIGGGVIQTTTQVTTGEQLAVSWDEKYDTQQILEGSIYGEERRFIYEVGSGNATLDALATEQDASDFQEFFPFLPIRLNNVSILDAPYDTNGLYEETKKAYRRATTKKFDKLVEEVEDNESISDIDYAYIMYGVSLNVRENACRKYLYNFFLEMRQFQSSDETTLSTFLGDIETYEQAQVDIQQWEDDVNNDAGEYTEPEARPDVPTIHLPPLTSLNFRTESELMPSYDIRLQWMHIEETQHSGVYTFTPVVGDPRDARKDEVQLVTGTPVAWDEEEGYITSEGNFTRTIPQTIPTLEIYWQVDDANYRKLTIYGLVHWNYIYGGKAVRITSAEALDDFDISGFIVPLHYPTMKAMSIVDYTQMATANVHILFNSYEVTKQKWYETLLFKILLIVLILVVAVILSPGSFAAGSGILGGNVAIGSALGLTGTAAIVAGVVANYLASIVISQLLQYLGTSIFGEKFGALFAALAGLVLSGGLSGGNIFSAQGLLQLTGALANGYAGWVRGDILEMNEQLQEEANAYEEQMDYINDLIAGLGGNDLNFNPLSLTDSSYGNGRSGTGGYMPETADEFIRRTTMTGTEVVEITHSMIHNFVDIQQTLPRN